MPTVGDIVLKIRATIENGTEVIQTIQAIGSALAQALKPPPVANTQAAAQLQDMIAIAKEMRAVLGQQPGNNLIKALYDIGIVGLQVKVTFENLVPTFQRMQANLTTLGSIAARPFIAMAQAAASALNPVNILQAAIRSLTQIANVAFGVLIGNALTELSRKALELINNLSPLTSGLVASQIEASFRGLSIVAANAGIGFQEVANSVNILRSTGFSAGEAIASLSRGIQIGLSPERVKELATAAQDLSVVIGEDAGAAFQKLLNAIVTGRAENLRFAGVMKTSTQIVQDFARAHGISAEQVRNNTALMREAFTEGILQEAKKFSGAYEASLDEIQVRIRDFQDAFVDLQAGFGQTFTPIIAASIGAAQQVVEQFSRLFFVTSDQSGETYGQIIAQGLTDANKAQADLNSTSGVYTRIQALTAAQVFELASAFDKFNAASKDGGEETIESQKELSETLQRIAKDTGVTEEQFKKLGDAGAFALERINKEGKAFDPSALTVRLFALNKALGQIVETGFGDAIKDMFGGLNLEQSVDNAIQFGINFVAGFSNGLLGGINQYLIPALVGVADTILAFLGIFSPTEEGPLSQNDPSEYGSNFIRDVALGIQTATPEVEQAASDAAAGIANAFDPLKSKALTALQEYGKTISRTVLAGLKIQDFGELNFLGGIAQSLLSTGGNDAQGLANAEAARRLIAEALSQINSSGAVAQSTLASVQGLLGGAFSDFARYFELLSQLTDEEAQQAENEKALAQSKLEIAAAEDKVREATERLRNFELDTADIPERYTRGRRRQLEQELDAAQQEEDRRRRAAEQLQEQIRAQEDANRNTREQLQLQRALIQELARQAEAQENINRLAQEESVPIPVAIEQNIKKLDELAAQFVEKYKKLILDAFAPVSEQFEKITAFVQGLFGQQLKLPDNFASLPDDEKRQILSTLIPAFQAGQNLATALKGIGAELSGAFKTVAEFFGSDDFKNGMDMLLKFIQDPTVQKGIVLAVTIAGLNFASGGLLGQLAAGLASVGLPLINNPIGWGILLGVTLYFTTDIESMFVTKQDVDEFWEGIEKGGADAVGAIFDVIGKVFANISVGLLIVKSVIGTIARSISGLLDLFNVETPQWIKDLIQISTLNNSDFISGIQGLLNQGANTLIPGLNTSGSVSIKPDEQSLGAVNTMVSEIKQTLINSGIPTTVAQYLTDPTRQLFIGLSDDLVGNSVVPDMIDAIIGEFGRGSASILSINGIFARSLLSIFQAMATNLLRLVDSLVRNVSGMFVSLGRNIVSFGTLSGAAINVFVALLLRSQVTIATILARVQISFSQALTFITEVWTRVYVNIENANIKIINSVTRMAGKIIDAFTLLADVLVGHSIVPDMANDIVAQFAGLSPRTEGTLDGFRKMVEGQMGAIDVGMNVNLPRGAKFGGRDQKITIDQSGWQFPANMDAAQMETLRRISREETYKGIVRVYEGVPASA
jgi:hypothetical protein